MQKIPYFSFKHQNNQIKDKVVQAILDVFDAEWYILGQQVAEFEKEYAAFNQVKYCLGVANGLDALFISLKVLDIGPGDDVLVPTNTFIATWLAVSQTGAKIIPVEPNLLTYILEPENLVKAITPKTKAIIPVHLYGQACNIPEIINLANQRNIFVIEDNAQAHGATIAGKKTGSFGHVNATSFYPVKNLGAFGDGGAITTNDEILAQKIKAFRNYGSTIKYYNDVIGINSRLDEMQAAILRTKLPYLDQWTAERIKIASTYHQLLKNIDGLILPVTSPESTHVYHGYVIRTNKRDELQKYLFNKGIETVIHYPVPPHLQKAYSHLGYKKGDFPVAELLAETCLSLPVWNGLSEAEIKYIAGNIKNFLVSGC